MDEKPEVIQQEIEETRSRLADRLDVLGEKFTGTVETVEETVEDVTETAADVVDSVKETFNITKQTQNHPWLVVGGAVVVGYLGGRLLDGALSRPPTPSYREYPRGPAPETGNGHSKAKSAVSSEAEADTGQEGWFSSLTKKFGPEMNALKGLAVGSLFGLARDMISRSLPDALRGDVEDVFDDATERAGGKPIQGHLVAEDAEEKHSPATSRAEKENSKRNAKSAPPSSLAQRRIS